ncbi:MAG: serine protease [Bacteroides sp.]|nr:hypothetical protein [Roseburia sp.]MCM1346198.1 serine protease [Bacteroides sp.]MCM1420665.1 serine protease [Bacteroides sp.]
METFSVWFGGLETMQQVFWVCALAGSAVFVIQLLLTLFGMDSSDIDIDFDAGDTLDLGGGLSLFSIRNLVNFFVGFGWAGVCLHSLISNALLLTLAATAVGLCFVWMFFFIYRQTRKLEANGAFRIEYCKGKVADVYLRIPENRSGRGKVQISVNGSVHELDAMTEGESVTTGSKVRVIDIVGGEMLVVEKI